MSDAAPASLLRHQPFVLFWIARVCTTVAFQVLGVAVGWQVYDLTSSALDLGLVGLTQFVPTLLLMLVAGQMADRYDRRTMLVVCEVTAGLSVAGLAVATAAGAVSKELIFVTVFLVGTARAFEAPVLAVLVPNLVPVALLPRAIAGSSSAAQTATIAGPALGGLIYAASPTLAYATCTALFLTAGACAAFIRVQRTAFRREPVSFAMFFAGIGFIRRNPIILGAISLDLFAVLLGGATALLPIFARDIFGTGPWGLGLMRAAPAVGALAMSIGLAHWPLRERVGPLMFAGVASFGVATIVFALSTSFALSVTALALLGASDMISVVIRQTLVQLETPDEMRGRVSAVNSLFVGTSNQLGEFRAGVMAAWFGAVPAVLIGGVGTLIIVVLWRRLFPQILGVSRFEDRASTHPR